MLSAYLLVVVLFNGPNAAPTVTELVMPPDEKACMKSLYIIRDSSPLGMRGQCVPVYEPKKDVR